MKYQAVAIVTVACLLACVPRGARSEPTGAPERLQHLQLGLSYPPMRDTAELACTEQHLRPLHITRIRTGESWAWREPQPGNLGWGALDQRMEFIKRNGLSLLLTIEMTAPEWAAEAPRNLRSCVFRDQEKFAAYLTALLQRYPGQIAKLQFGNEWQTPYWWAGSAEQYTQAHNTLYRTVKQVSPQTQVVLGGLTRGAVRVLAAQRGLVTALHGEGNETLTGDALAAYLQRGYVREASSRTAYGLEHAQYDLLDLHLYDDVDYWAGDIELLRQLAPGKPILVSEFGGPHPTLEPPTEEYQAQQLSKYLRTLDGAGIEEAYYFRLVAGGAGAEHPDSALLTAKLVKRAAYEVFASFVPASWQEQ